MSALAKGDIKTLTDMTYLRGENREQIEKQWKFAVEEVSPNYLFRWDINHGRELSGSTASVSIKVWRNAMSQSTYDEKFELPLVKNAETDGKWKVDVTGINREMYPGLPR